VIDDWCVTGDIIVWSWSSDGANRSVDEIRSIDRVQQVQSRWNTYHRSRFLPQ